MGRAPLGSLDTQSLAPPRHLRLAELLHSLPFPLTQGGGHPRASLPLLFNDQVHGMTLVGTSQANKEASPVSTTDTESVGCLYLVKKDVVSFSIFFLIT